MTQTLNGTADASEPLEPSLWFERFQVIGSRAQASGHQTSESSLRHLFHLAKLTPAPLAPLFGIQVCEASFEQLLEREQYDCAALLLLGRGVDFAIWRSVDAGAVTATLSLAGGQPESTATADTLSQAILTAYCAAIVSLGDRASLPLLTTGQARRTSRSAPRRLSMTH